MLVVAADTSSGPPPSSNTSAAATPIPPAIAEPHIAESEPRWYVTPDVTMQAKASASSMRSCGAPRWRPQRTTGTDAVIPLLPEPASDITSMSSPDMRA